MDHLEPGCCSAFVAALAEAVPVVVVSVQPGAGGIEVTYRLDDGALRTVAHDFRNGIPIPGQSALVIVSAGFPPVLKPVIQ